VRCRRQHHQLSNPVVCVTVQRDLGNAIVNFCRVVPDGLLVFFPSYTMLESCTKVWNQRTSSMLSIMDNIQTKKAVSTDRRR
jgi:Rad3-related DNA helicase